VSSGTRGITFERLSSVKGIEESVVEFAASGFCAV
jgi:hypothetical protein